MKKNIRFFFFPLSLARASRAYEVGVGLGSGYSRF